MDAVHAFLSRVQDDTGSSGPLADLRLAVKDNIAVKGEPFTAGLPLFAERRAEKDASCVTRLKDAGARFVGMTRTDAAGFGVVTPDVANPVWPDRIVGGSSGGSAAAIAAGLADIGLGTDTGGSTRIPAACCGIFGFKPSHGRIPLDGVWPLAPSFDVVGWMTRDLVTLEKVAAVLLGDALSPDIATDNLKIGFDPVHIEQSAPEVQRAITGLQSKLAHVGVQFRPVALPAHDAVTHAHGVMVLSEALEVYRSFLSDTELLPGNARRSLEVAKTIPEEAVAIARTQLAAITRDFEAACVDADAILTPTLPVEPPATGLRRLQFRGRSEPIVSVLVSETCLANIAGAPALSMPIPDTVVSLQLLVPKHCDAQLFAIAHALQTATGPGFRA